MADLLRGQVWWAEPEPPAGTPPVLLLTRDTAISRLTNVTVAPLTRQVRRIPTEVQLDIPTDGVPVACAVSLDNIQTIEVRTLVQFIATLRPSRMTEVATAVKLALDL